MILYNSNSIHQKYKLILRKPMYIERGKIIHFSHPKSFLLKKRSLIYFFKTLESNYWVIGHDKLQETWDVPIRPTSRVLLWSILNTSSTLRRDIEESSCRQFP